MTNTLIDSMKRGQNKTALTENLAVSHNSTLDAVLDLYARGGALRAHRDEFVRLFRLAWAENPQLALRCLFYIRDARGGAGERELFRAALVDIANDRKMSPALALNMYLIPEYGRWDDLFCLFTTRLWPEARALIVNSLGIDLREARADGSISLLAKWLPSESAGRPHVRRIADRRLKKALSKESALKRAVARDIGKAAFGDARSTRKVYMRRYRKAVASLRKRLDLVESALSQKRTGEIDFSHVPAGAMRLYGRKAFPRIEPERWNRFIAQVTKGEKKIKATSVMPYDLVKDYRNGAPINDAIEAIFDQMVEDYASDEDTLYVCDVSASMSTHRLPDSSAYPVDVSTSLTILQARANRGKFRNHSITFAGRPILQQHYGNSLYEDLKYLMRNRADMHDMSTNIQAVFQLILQFATANRLPESEMPRRVVIISDMQFNSCARNTNLWGIQEQFESAGYFLPQLVFWNVEGRQKEYPAEKDEQGVVLISGFSPSVYKAVAGSTRFQTPLDVMLDTLNGERYSRIVVR